MSKAPNNNPTPQLAPPRQKSKGSSRPTEHIVGKLPNGNPISLRTHNLQLRLKFEGTGTDDGKRNRYNKSMKFSPQKLSSAVASPETAGRLSDRGSQLQSPQHAEDLKKSLSMAMSKRKNRYQKKSTDLAYDSVFKTRDYHLIHERGELKGKFSIMPNSLDYGTSMYPIERHPADFANYQQRIHESELTTSPNENRFLNFDYNPSISTRTKYCPKVSFDRMLPRSLEKTIYPMKQYQCEYDHVDRQKERVMPRLTNGVIKFRRQEPRRVGQGFGGYLKPAKDIQTLSVCNDEKAVEASREKVNNRKHSLALASLETCMPRDLKMYQQTEFMKNIYLENTRGEREKELDRMKRLRRMGGSYVGAAHSIIRLVKQLE